MYMGNVVEWMGCVVVVLLLMRLCMLRLVVDFLFSVLWTLRPVVVFLFPVAQMLRPQDRKRFIKNDKLCSQHRIKDSRAYGELLDCATLVRAASPLGPVDAETQGEMKQVRNEPRP